MFLLFTLAEGMQRWAHYREHQQGELALFPEWAAGAGNRYCLGRGGVHWKTLAHRPLRDIVPANPF